MTAPLAPLTQYSARAENAEGTMAFVVRDSIKVPTFMSYAHMDIEGRSLKRLIMQGSMLTMQRNACIQQMEGEYLLFIDDDMVFDPGAVKRIIEIYEELKPQFPVFMVGGLCFRRQSPYQPTLYVREEPDRGAYNFIERWDDDVVEVDATGCAFLLIPKNVFETIAETKMPPYEARMAANTLPEFFRWDRSLSEDLQFCQDAKAKGVRIFVDTRIEIGHIAEVEIRKEQYLVELAKRTPRGYADRLVVNRRMGLPTVSPREAKEALGW